MLKNSENDRKLIGYSQKEQCLEERVIDMTPLF